MKTALTRLAAAAATGVLALSLVAAHGDASTEAELSGFAEVGETQGNSPAGDASGSGTAIAYTGEVGEELCVYLEVDRLQRGEGSEVTGVHIHEGAADENGPVVVNLTDLYDAETRTIDGCVTLDSGPAVAAITLADFDEREFYVNLHTERHPAGAIRGQLE